MTNTEIETLCTFAEQNNESAFAHLCTAAIAGEQWAIERVEFVIGAISTITEADGDIDEAKLAIIQVTRTIRPDGAIARRIKL